MKKYLFILIISLSFNLYSLAPLNNLQEKKDLLYPLLKEEFYNSNSLYPFHPDWFAPYTETLSPEKILEFCQQSRSLLNAAVFPIYFLPYELEVINKSLPDFFKTKLKTAKHKEINISITITGLGMTSIKTGTEIVWLLEKIYNFLAKNPHLCPEKIHFNVNAYDIDVKILNFYNNIIPIMLNSFKKPEGLNTDCSFSVNPFFADITNPLCQNAITAKNQDIFIWRNTHVIDIPGFSLIKIMNFINAMKKSLNPQGFILAHETDQFGEKIPEIEYAV